MLPQVEGAGDRTGSVVDHPGRESRMPRKGEKRSCSPAGAACARSGGCDADAVLMGIERDPLFLLTT
jgi:hypothetical protein